MNSDQYIFLVTQKDITEETLDNPNVYDIGVFAKVKQVLKKNDGVAHVLVEGICRAKLVKYIKNDNFITAKISKIENLKCAEISTLNLQ